MEQVVNLDIATKSNGVFCLRKLLNKVKSNMQNLRSLGVDSENYGKLVVLVLN